MRLRRSAPEPGAETAPTRAGLPAHAERASPASGGDAPASSPATGVERVVAVVPIEERVAQLERKLAIRTYALGAASVLALAAGIVGVVLALSAKDESATKGEVRTLREEVQGVGEEAAAAAEDDVASLSGRLEDLEGRASALAGDQRTTEGQLSVVEDDLEDLRTQISDLESAPPSSDGAGFDATDPDSDPGDAANP